MNLGAKGWVTPRPFYLSFSWGFVHPTSATNSVGRDAAVGRVPAGPMPQVGFSSYGPHVSRPSSRSVLFLVRMVAFVKVPGVAPLAGGEGHPSAT